MFNQQIRKEADMSDIIVNSVTFNTPAGNFEAKFDHLHQHRYPSLHGGNQMGARFNQIDLDTGKKTAMGSFELNISPPGCNPLLK